MPWRIQSRGKCRRGEAKFVSAWTRAKNKKNIEISTFTLIWSLTSRKSFETFFSKRDQFKILSGISMRDVKAQKSTWDFKLTAGELENRKKLNMLNSRIFVIYSCVILNIFLQPTWKYGLRRNPLKTTRSMYFTFTSDFKQYCQASFDLFCSALTSRSKHSSGSQG